LPLKKHFFFEKKKQKTFTSLDTSGETDACERTKVFWFPQGGRRLSFKKEHSCYAAAPCAPPD
jgi:hypothetical protein